MFTIDTNILISYLNDEEDTVKQFSKWRKASSRFSISVITKIKILSLPVLTSEEINKIQRFLREFTIIPLDSQLGRIVAEIRRQYKLKLGDSIVAATAKLTNSTLVTNDKELIKKGNNFIKIQTIR